MEKKFQVLTAPKVANVSVQEVTDELTAQYPAYTVEVHEADNEFVAKLTRKQAAPPSGKVPPFLDEDDADKAPDDVAPKGDSEDDDDDAPADDDAPDADEKPKGDKADKKDGEDGGDDLTKALHALDTLKGVLPKLEKQLKTLGGGELPEGLGDGPLGPDGAPAGPDGPGAPGGPGGLGAGPSQADLDAIGPTPGKPTPGNAAPRIPGMGGKGPVPPRPNVGVPTFGHVKQNKFVYRPAFNEDGSQISMEEATREIAGHPRYASYDVKEVRFDEDGQQYVAHLKLR